MFMQEKNKACRDENIKKRRVKRMVRDTKELELYLDKMFEEKKYPGVAICIRGPEGILFEKGYGYRNMEQKREDQH